MKRNSLSLYPSSSLSMSVLCLNLFILSNFCLGSSQDFVSSENSFRQKAVSIHNDLRTLRDSTEQTGRRFRIETWMTLMASGVRLAIEDLSKGPSVVGEIGELIALKQELKMLRLNMQPFVEQDTVLQAIDQKISNLMESVTQKIQSLITSPDTGDALKEVTPLNRQWRQYIGAAITYDANQTQIFDKVLRKLRRCAEQSSAVVTPVTSPVMSASLSVLSEILELRNGFVVTLREAKDAGSAGFSWWARAKYAATRTDALEQIAAEWIVNDLALGCTIPPSLLKEVVGEGKSCYKMSSGNEPGTSTGMAGSGSGSPCTMVQVSAGSVPIPKP